MTAEELANTDHKMTAAPSADALAAMGQAAFDRLVRDSVRSDTDPAIWDALTTPEVVLRTRAALAAIRADVQSQMAIRNAELQEKHAEGLRLGSGGRQMYLEAAGDQAEWRKRAISFQRQLNRRAAYVTSRVPKNQPPNPAGSRAIRKHNLEALEKLARAVAAHRDRVLSGEGSEDDDETLWESLEDITAKSVRGGEMPLGRWVDWMDEIRDEDAEQRG